MQIIEIKNSDKEKWNNFVLAHKGEFLQSWEWGDFQTATGKKIWRIALAGENDEFLAAALVIRHDLPLGNNYLYCPRGPVLANGKWQMANSKISELLFGKIREIEKKENSVFWRIEPEKEIIIPQRENRKEGINLQPRDTLILDLGKTEEELLAQMKQKTRYNVRLAEKHGVKVRISDEETFGSDLEKFWALTEETTVRDKFFSHSKEYYRKMLKSLNGEISSWKLSARIFLAEFEGKALAANIMLFFGERAIYLHGASGAAYRNFMAPYLLQWEQIRRSREFGFKEYDFWGIIGNEKLKMKNEKVKSENDKINSWAGITRFKTGFGGQEINYPEAVDIIYRPMIYKVIKITKQAKAFLK